MQIRVESSGLRKWEADLGRFEARLVPKVHAVVKKASVNIKNDWRDTWLGHSYIKPLARSVSFDFVSSFTSVKVEIGPDKDRPQGALGNIIEFGGPKNKPIPAGLMALRKETPILLAELAKVQGEVLDGR
ncbi:hypothetical protein AB0I28_12615 [Phytomonospora sp. NPDC050363]|uniref:hypothetical protein n=1 Tax=Phytomonospora sp. NPDC050363 TaxID=3155642 RepID=UPI0033D9CF26